MPIYEQSRGRYRARSVYATLHQSMNLSGRQPNLERVLKRPLVFAIIASGVGALAFAWGYVQYAHTHRRCVHHYNRPSYYGDHDFATWREQHSKENAHDP